jgi:GTP-binding protein YchF
MEVGIIGLPQSGKSSLFQALTGLQEGPPGAASRIGVARVPDPRLKKLEELLRPKKASPAEVKYIDITMLPKGLAAALPAVQRADALVLVVRAFRNDAVPHPQGSLDPRRDLEALSMEFSFSDMAILEHRMEKLALQLKAGPSLERENLLREQTFLLGVKAGLEKEIPVREQALPEEGARALESFALFTAKPWLLVLNIGEEDIPRTQALEEEWQARYPKLGVVAICARLEKELSELPEAEAGEFRASLGLKQSALDRLIRLSYERLGLISFFTVVSGEMRAWTVRRGTPAVKAAGKVHSDIERGFIRAEVVAYEDFVRAGSMAEARRRGLLRLEGKTHPVQDGDIITFLFNV